MNTITCIGHSGFAIETASTTLIFDYYTDHEGVLTAILERAKAIYVFVSHSHRDHLNPDIFGWAATPSHGISSLTNADANSSVITTPTSSPSRS